MLARTRLRLFVLALTAALGACASESSVAPEGASSGTSPLTLTAVLDQLGMAGGLVGTIGPMGGAGVAALPRELGIPTCAYSALTQSFICPTVTGEGYTVTNGYVLLDAAGKPQSEFDATKTASVRSNATFAGTLRGTGYALVVDGRQDLALTGLLTATHLLNGTSSVHTTGNVDYNTISYPVDVTAKTTIADLALPHPSVGQGWPASGTISVESTSALGAGLPPATARVTMTFNGTSTVALVATRGGVTLRCTFDLANVGYAGCG